MAYLIFLQCQVGFDSSFVSIQLHALHTRGLCLYSKQNAVQSLDKMTCCGSPGYNIRKMSQHTVKQLGHSPVVAQNGPWWHSMALGDTNCPLVAQTAPWWHNLLVALNALLCYQTCCADTQYPVNAIIQKPCMTCCPDK